MYVALTWIARALTLNNFHWKALTFHFADVFLDVGHAGGTGHALDGQEALLVVPRLVHLLVEVHGADRQLHRAGRARPP